MRAQVVSLKKILVSEAGEPRNLPSMRAPDNSTFSKVDLTFFFGKNQQGVPFGISTASVLTDRPGINDVGHGLMFHFDNQYTVGITGHAGDEGIFITVDMLKLFQDKNEQLGKYKVKVKSKFALEPEQ